MTYTIVKHSVQHSSCVYTGIHCNSCEQTSYCLDDIQSKQCRFCGLQLKSRKADKSKSGYGLYWSKSNKSLKAHWSVNGDTALCMAGVSGKVSDQVDNHQVCVNCATLKSRGFHR